MPDIKIVGKFNPVGQCHQVRMPGPGPEALTEYHRHYRRVWFRTWAGMLSQSVHRACLGV
jgi:hypothetical protein